MGQNSAGKFHFLLGYAKQLEPLLYCVPHGNHRAWSVCLFVLLERLANSTCGLSSLVLSVDECVQGTVQARC